ncbi:hypothetical protein KY290_033108 [Solanum tuberosum]|uniref:Uncharacterized protein n=1 Tax=Solanum tuberosum TaxID=4113 RepID=A0ABQ7TZM4_SOLTU|nr:hypothetical protein KY289_034617 [Solanum tuberosum]KAH0647107.1 hypothetical protein KY285_032355 [Solanum tuberosum]KAH0740065.1 hypothetical protein KY290_033108 [Solanum tuberosum]
MVYISEFLWYTLGHACKCEPSLMEFEGSASEKEAKEDLDDHSPMHYADNGLKEVLGALRIERIKVDGQWVVERFPPCLC